MALILVVSALALGAGLVRRLRMALYPFEAVALAVVLGLFSWTWLVLLAALVMPYDVAVPLAVTAAAAATVWAAQPASLRAGQIQPASLRAGQIQPAGERPGWRRLEGGRGAWALWAGASLVTAAVLGRLFWTHSLVSADGGLYTGGSSWGDFGLHASLVSHFAADDRLPLDLPVASGAELTYPFLADLLSALLVRDGAGLHLSLFLPSVLLALAFCQLLLAFGLRLFGHLGAAVTGLFLFLLLGSAAGLRFAWSDWRDSGRGLLDFVTDPPKDYTSLSEENLGVTNVISHALLPQRPILFGLGVGLAVLILLHTYRAGPARELAGGAGGGRRLLFAAAILTGLLPLAHAHTFIVAGAVLAALAVEAAVRERRAPRDLLAAGGLAVGVALPQLAWQQLANSEGTGGRFRLGWMSRPGEGVTGFWADNFGLMGLFLLALPVLLYRNPAWRRHLLWYLPFLVILGVTQVYAFQPFEFDNLKLIFWVYLVGGLFAGWLAVEAVRRSRWALVLVVPCLVAVTVPGALSVAHEWHKRDQFASPDDLALAGWARGNTAVDDVFVGADRPNQPVATLAGRRVVLGYRGWLFSYHLPYADREAAVREALAGRADAPALRRFGADYLVLAAHEDAAWPVDRAAVERLGVAYRNDAWAVYRVAPSG